MKTQIGQDIEKAAGFLKAGKPVGVPTETVYGLAGLISNFRGIDSIFKVKNRPDFDPLIVHAADQEYLFNELASELPKIAEDLAKAFWPGPLTLVVKKRAEISSRITADLNTVAIRVPNHPLFRRLLEHLNEGVAAPSANPFGFVSPTSAKHVNDQLGGKIPYILDGGPSNIGLESTILDISEFPLRLLRPGAITKSQLQKVCGSEILSLKASNKVLAPGTLEKHYSPRTPTLPLNELEGFQKKFPHKKVGAVIFENLFPLLNEQNQFVLSEGGNLDEAARNFYAALRLMDKRSFDVLFLESFKNEGIGVALNDRLKRALKH